MLGISYVEHPNGVRVGNRLQPEVIGANRNAAVLSFQRINRAGLRLRLLEAANKIKATVECVDVNHRARSSVEATWGIGVTAPR